MAFCPLFSAWKEQEITSMNSEKKFSLFVLAGSVCLFLRLMNPHLYGSIADKEELLIHYRVVAFWILSDGILYAFLTFMKDRSAFMKKAEEKGKFLMAVVTLIMANLYRIFINSKIAGYTGSYSPLSVLENLISTASVIAVVIFCLIYVRNIKKH